MSEKLKPCPFCGCDELTVLRSNQIECDLCLALAAHDKQWNSRPAEQALAEKDAEIERLTALVPKWISVEDELPELYVDVAAIQNGWPRKAHMATPTKWWDCSEGELYDITHWMPLPPAPEASDASPNS